MTSVYGPQGWNPREAAAECVADLDHEGMVERGRAMWEALGSQPHPDEFWNIVAPLVHALAAKDPDEVGYGKGFSAATACEQLMHEVQLYRERGDIP